MWITPFLVQRRHCRGPAWQTPWQGKHEHRVKSFHKGETCAAPSYYGTIAASAAAAAADDLTSAPANAPNAPGDDAPPLLLGVRLLGGFEVHSLGRPVSIAARKDRWLLALLALANGRPRLRRELQDALWPPESGGAGGGPAGGDPAYNLRRGLSNLRRALPRYADRFEAPTRDAVRLAPDGIWVDALAFDAAAAAAPDPPRWVEAAALYAGPLLPDCAEPWVLGERQARQQAYQDLVVRLADAALTTSQEVQRREAATGPAGSPVGVEQARQILLRTLTTDPPWPTGRGRRDTGG